MRNSNLILFAAAISFQLLIANTSTSQTYENTQVTFKLKNTSLKKIISEIEKQTPYRFAFVESDIASFKNKDVDFVKEYLPRCLSKIFESSDISFKLVDNTIIILKKKTSSVATTEVINDNTHSPPHRLGYHWYSKRPKRQPAHRHYSKNKRHKQFNAYR